MAARVQEVKDHLEKALRDKTKPWAPLLDMAESKTGLDRMYIFIGKNFFFHCSFRLITG